MSKPQWREVAGREIRTRARTRAFRIITGILVFVAIAAPIALTLWPGGDDSPRDVTVGFVEPDESTQDAILVLSGGVLDVDFEDLSDIDNDMIESMLASGELDLVVESGHVLVWDRTRDFELSSIVYTAVQQQELIARGGELGLGEDEMSTLLTPAEIEERFLDETEEPEDLARVAAFVGLMLTFMIPQIYGQLAMLSVVEEKASRVIEILLSHIRPKTLLIGKVVGIGCLAALQMLVITAGATAALLATNTVDIPPAVWRFVPVVLLSVLGGLAVYNTFFALLGSLISRQEDAAQIMPPILIPLFAGFFVAQTVITNGEASWIARVLTLFPLTAPMLLPVRVALDTISAGEVALSIVFLILGVWGLIRLAGRVYEFTLLHTGARVSWSGLIRLIKGGDISA